MTLNAGDIRQTQRWRRLSRAKLLETPLCQDCAERGISAAAVEVTTSRTGATIPSWRSTGTTSGAYAGAAMPRKPGRLMTHEARVD
jgi:hypothetical protein